MKTNVCLLACWSLLLLMSPSCQAVERGEFTSIPAAGGDIVQIVIADPCNPVQKSCADDVQRIFSLVTGSKVGISTIAPEGRCLYIGCAPKGVDVVKKLATLNEDGVYLVVSPEAVICTGRTNQGVYNAVQEMLYRTGYRNIWPGQYGECIPEGKKISLGDMVELTYNPSFMLRGGHSVQVEALPGQKPAHVNVENWVDWAARNHINRYKAGYCSTWDYGAERAHGWQEISGHTSQDIFAPAYEFGKGRPEEWYALFNGKRVAKHPMGTTAQACVSNPDFIDFVTKTLCDYFANNPNAKRYMICAADEPSYWCTCENCRAWDPKQFDCNWTPYGPGLGLQPRCFHMADRWLRFVNIVAQRVEKQFPDRWVGTFAYSGTCIPPFEVVPNKNVMVEICIPDLCRKHTLLDSNCPNNRECMERIQGWNKISSSLSIYGYLEYEHWEIPEAFFHSASDLYKSLYGLGIRNIADEIDSTPHASPVYMGLWSRLLWDVNTAPDKYVTEFCKIAYGDAGPVMEQFWRYQEEVMQNSKVAHRSQADIERFTPEVLKKSYALLQSALDKKLSKDQIARVQRAKMSVLMAEYYTAKGMVNEKSAKAWLKAFKCKKDIFQIASEYGFTIELMAWNSLGGNEDVDTKISSDGNQYSIPMAAIEGDMLLEMPDTWLFRKDPGSQGETEKWYSEQASLDQYKPLSINKNWESQWVGDYDGCGWYTTEVVIPQTTAKHVWLLFGAVDDSWKAWLNGKYIGASKGDPGKIWELPAAVEITGKYEPQQKVRITVMVHDQVAAGGIWRPVTITTSNAETNQ